MGHSVPCPASIYRASPFPSNDNFVSGHERSATVIRKKGFRTESRSSLNRRRNTGGTTRSSRETTSFSLDACVPMIRRERELDENGSARLAPSVQLAICRDRIIRRTKARTKAIARHREVRSMFRGNSVAGKGLSPGGTASNTASTPGRASQSRACIETSQRPGCSVPFPFPFSSPPFPSILDDPPFLFPPHLLLSSFLTSPSLEFQQQRRGGIDNGSSRLSSLFYTHHLTPGIDGRRGGGTANPFPPPPPSRGESGTRNSIDRNHWYCRNGI